MSNLLIENSLSDKITTDLKKQLSTIVDFEELEINDNDVGEELRTEEIPSEALDN